MPAEAWQQASGEGSSDSVTHQSGRRWYLVHAHTGREAIAQANLRRQLYSTFLPTLICTVRHARKLESVERALFPGYLFVALNLGRERWRSINSTVGVIRLVCQGAEPSPVPGSLVDELVSVADSSGVVQRPHPLAAGDRVMMVRGPFSEQLALVLELEGKDRVKLLLSVLASEVEIRAPISYCSKVLSI